MPIDNNINETVVWRSSSTGTRAPVGPILQRYGDFELHYAALAEAAPTPIPPIVDPTQLSPTERLAFAAFQLRHSEPYRAAKLVRPRDKETWDMKGCIAPPPPEALTPVAGVRAAATMPTSGWLEGSVAIGTIMVNGPTNDLRFTDTEQTKVVAEVQAGLSWLAAQALSSRVTFVHDIHLVQIDTAADATATDLEGL